MRVPDMDSAPDPQPRADLRWLAVDLDGTLAESVWQTEGARIGSPLWANVLKMLRAKAAG